VTLDLAHLPLLQRCLYAADKASQDDSCQTSLLDLPASLHAHGLAARLGGAIVIGRATDNLLKAGLHRPYRTINYTCIRS